MIIYKGNSMILFTDYRKYPVRMQVYKQPNLTMA